MNKLRIATIHGNGVAFDDVDLDSLHETGDGRWFAYQFSAEVPENEVVKPHFPMRCMIGSVSHLIASTEKQLRKKIGAGREKYLSVHQIDGLRHLMQTHNLTGKAVGDLAGVDDRTVRRWLAASDSEGYRRIPYAAWYTLRSKTNKPLP